MEICLSHGGPITYLGREQADEMLVGTVGGVYKLERQDNKLWQVAWNTLEGNHVSAVQREPKSGRVFAGIYKGGVSASDDSGKSWTPCNEGLGSDDVYSLSLAETAEGTKVYAGTQPAHLYESDDLGESWRDISSLREVPSVNDWTFPAPPHVAHVKFIAIDPNDSNVIYAAIEVGGLLKSTDGGKTWTENHGFYEDVHRIVICRNDSQKVYISTGAGLYHTTNGGKEWKQLTDHRMHIGYPDALIVVPGQENLMFMSGARNTPGAWRKIHTADSRIARSRDGGVNWELLSEGLPGHMRGNMESISIVSWNGSFELFAGTTDGDIYYTDDQGDHWTKIAAGLPPISKSNHYRGLR